MAETMTGDINNGTYVLAGCLFVSGALIMAIPRSMLGTPSRTPVATPTGSLTLEKA